MHPPAPPAPTDLHPHPLHPQIFTERPEVHRAFLAYVPTTMTEAQFWTAYFKHEYKRMARRRRVTAAGKPAGAGCCARRSSG